MIIIDNYLVKIETKDIINGKLTIPAQVTSVEPDCGIYTEDKIVEISVDEGNSSFTTKDGVLYSKDMTKLIKYPSKKQGSKFEIPESVTEIGDCAFQNCTQLTQLKIPDNYLIKPGDFFGLCSIEKYVIGKKNPNYTLIRGVLYSKDKIQLVKYPPNRKGNKYIIDLKTTTIGKEAFNYCKHLVEIVLPDGLQDIETFAFAESGIKSIEIPPNVRRIGWHAFHHCTDLESLVIPEGVEEIGQDIVVGCTSLNKVEFPTSLKEIPRNSFFGCEKLTSVVVPKRWIESIRSYLEISRLSQEQMGKISITDKEEKPSTEFRKKYITNGRAVGVEQIMSSELDEPLNTEIQDPRLS